MRALHQTGRLSTPKLAALVSFAVHYLWLDWKAPANFLARLRIDFEAGLHYPLIQTWAGTTHTKPAQIFDPVEQSRALAPGGQFIRQWVPALSDLPTQHIQTPWTAPQHTLVEAGVTLGQTYPEPIIEHRAAARMARKNFPDCRHSLAGQLMQNPWRRIKWQGNPARSQVRIGIARRASSA